MLQMEQAAWCSDLWPFKWEWVYFPASGHQFFHWCRTQLSLVCYSRALWCNLNELYFILKVALSEFIGRLFLATIQKWSWTFQQKLPVNTHTHVHQDQRSKAVGWFLPTYIDYREVIVALRGSNEIIKESLQKHWNAVSHLIVFTGRTTPSPDVPQRKLWHTPAARFLYQCTATKRSPWRFPGSAPDTSRNPKNSSSLPLPETFWLCLLISFLSEKRSGAARMVWFLSHLVEKECSCTRAISRPAKIATFMLSRKIFKKKRKEDKKNPKIPLCYYYCH